MPKKILLSLALLAITSTSFAKVVTFRIPANTGKGNWNTRAKPVEVKVGDVLRIFNDDSVDHYLHTNNDRPCKHGTGAFKPTKSYDCVVTAVADPDKDTCRDHNLNGKFYVRSTN